MDNAASSAALRRACDTPLPFQAGHWRFDCSCCLGTITDQALVIIHSDRICISCFQFGVKPQFIAALADESQFPVEWGGKEIELKHYRLCFTKDFRYAWKAKLQEYSVPPAKRFYCQGRVDTNTEKEICNKFLGRKRAGVSIEHCKECGCDSCAFCGSVVGSTDHICSGSNTTPEVDPFAELKRGVDYQRCPGCDMAVELRDGCNHITCRLGRCSQHFCFLCGLPATIEDGHWRAGKPCPLYHQPDAANAQYDAGIPDAAEVALIDRIRDEAEQDLILGRINHIAVVDIPDEIRERRAHRVELDGMLRAIENEVIDLVGLGLLAESWAERLEPFRQMHGYLDLLWKSLFAYTIKLETDEIIREGLTRLLDEIGQRIITSRATINPEMQARFPRAEEIFLQMAEAAMQLIPAEADAAAQA
ncbi:hypothetical protein DOTSEDRAFT_33337 [Dothistroma septosporum NZE10]|uniref:Uncharacterized protein n=1 Tax=Dothistroma septosporum (strain NZE10 / CBS 128990) TaxID=675120 RepID=N1PTK5_DOTSN|nr:hypothetical protein DOTSEDRAFT_33337 [Dothistroma septosporum NZE10]